MPTIRRNHAQLALVAAVVLLLTLAGYRATFGDFFLSDDFAAVAMTQNAAGWRDSLAPDTGFQQSWLRPLPNLVWWWNHRLFGLDPLGYRVTNALLHALNGLLLALLAVRYCGCSRTGILAGAIFVAFPIHPEAVTWVCARYDLLCTGGVLGALLCWHAYRGANGGTLAFAGTVACTAWALASKEMAFALAPLLLITAWAGPRPRRTWPALAGLGLVFATYLGLRYTFLDGFGGMPGPDGRITSQLRPARLSFVYDAATYSFTPTLRLPLGRAWLPLMALPPLALIGGAWLGLATRPREAYVRQLGFIAALFGLSLLPIASWATFWGGHGTRYLYLPAAFSSMAMALCLVQAGRRRRNRTPLLAAATLVPFLVGLIHVNGHWHVAATRAEAMVTSLPAAPPGAALHVTGLPDYYGDAHLFLNGFRLAAQIYGGADGPVRVLDRPSWEDRRRKPKRSSDVFLEWDSANQSWSQR